MKEIKDSKKKVLKAKKDVATTQSKVVVKESVKNVSKTDKKYKKVIIGTVISNNMKNTVVVSMTRKVPHKMYGKLVKVTKKIKADTNGMEISVGDLVRIEQTRPISREKFFKVIKKEGLADSK